eukprot:5110308-Prymnesium_polylepis.1
MHAVFGDTLRDLAVGVVYGLYDVWLWVGVSGVSGDRKSWRQEWIHHCACHSNRPIILHN